VPSVITGGPDNDVWFSLANLKSIGGIKTDGTFLTAWKVPVVTSINSLVTGPDKKLWYGDETQIVQLDQSTGATHQISLGNLHNAYDITVGPDGNLWWTDGYGYLSTMPASIMGSPVTTPIPNADGTPEWITVGPDNNIWIVTSQPTGARILSYTTSGIKVQDATLPSDLPAIAGALPWGPTSITTGSDGNLWVTETGQNANASSLLGRILKINTNGSVLSTYSYNAVPGQAVGSITSIPNGPLYVDGAFVLGNGVIADYSIGKIDPNTGTIQILSVPASAGPAEQTLGPDGNIWTADPLGNNISRLAINH
jgi:virginiamycin B lyase